MDQKNPYISFFKIAESVIDSCDKESFRSGTRGVFDYHTIPFHQIIHDFVPSTTFWSHSYIEHEIFLDLLETLHLYNNIQKRMILYAVWKRIHSDLGLYERKYRIFIGSLLNLLLSYRRRGSGPIAQYSFTCIHNWFILNNRFDCYDP